MSPREIEIRLAQIREVFGYMKQFRECDDKQQYQMMRKFLTSQAIWLDKKKKKEMKHDVKG